MKPTHEQEAIRAAFTSGQDLVVEAGAGTGKTTTLKLLANSDYARGRKGLYLAFNKKIAQEAAETFDRNVTCRTAHSLALGFLSSKLGRAKYPGMRDKAFAPETDLFKGFNRDSWYEALFQKQFPIQKMSQPSESIVNFAETGHPGLTMKMDFAPYYGSAVELNAWDILRMVEETIRNYCISGDFSIGNQHVAGYEASMRIVAKVNKAAFHKLMVARHLYNIERLHNGIAKISQTIKSGADSDTFKAVAKEVIKDYVPNEEAYDIWKSSDRSRDGELTLLFRYLSDQLAQETNGRSVAGKHAASFTLNLKNIKELQARQELLIKSFCDLCTSASFSTVQGVVRGNRSLMSVYEPQSMAFYSPKRGFDIINGWEFSFKLLDRYFKDDGSGNVVKLYDYVLKYARIAWSLIKDADSDISIGFDHILKMWQEAKPQMGYDFIFFDEAQDANPVMAQLILSQNSGKSNSQIVVVGDENQSIYDFRGASGAMKMFKKHAQASSFIIKQLTECFRFGPEIAKAANNILAHTNSDLRLIGASPYDSEVRTFPQVDWEETDAIICRKNSEILEAGIEALQNGRVPIIAISAREMTTVFNTLMEFLKAAQGGNVFEPEESSPFYGCTNYPEAYQYFQESEDMALERSLANSVKLGNKDAEGRLTEAGINQVLTSLYELEQARFKKNHPDRIDIVSAHTSKGMEWDHIALWRFFGTTSISSNCPFERDHSGLPQKEDGKYVVKGDIVDQEYNINYVAITRAKKSVSLPLATDSHDLSALIRYGSPYDTGTNGDTEIQPWNLSTSSAHGVDVTAETFGIEKKAPVEDSGLLDQLMLVTFNEDKDMFEVGPSLRFEPEPQTVDVYHEELQKATIEATLKSMNHAYHSKEQLRAIPLYLTTKRAFEFSGKNCFLLATSLSVSGRAGDSRLNLTRRLDFYDCTLRKVSSGVIAVDPALGGTEKSQEDAMIEMLAFLDSAPELDLEQVVSFAKPHLSKSLAENPEAGITLDDLAEINEVYQRESATLRVTNLPGFPVQVPPHSGEGKHLFDVSATFNDMVFPYAPVENESNHRGAVADFLIAVKRNRDVHAHVELRRVLRSYFHNPHATPLRWEVDSTSSYINLFGRKTEAELKWEAESAEYEQAIKDTEGNDLSSVKAPGARPEGRVIYTAPIPPGTHDKALEGVLLASLRDYMTGVVVSDHEHYADQ